MSQPLQFSLAKIETTQFAVIERPFSKEATLENVALTITLPFGVNIADKIIVSFGHFSFELDRNPFLIIEVRCYMQIGEDSWQLLFVKDQGVIKIEKDALIHFAMVCVGTARGVLHAKTENTPYNRFLLPTINIFDIIKEDLIIPLLQSGLTDHSN